jgi:hypothetical protein
MFDFNFVTLIYIVLIILPFVQFFMFLATKFKVSDLEVDLKHYENVANRTYQKTNKDIEALNIRLTTLEEHSNKQSKTKK